MLRYGETELRRLEWYGLKKVLVGALLLPPVNAAMVSIAERFLAGHPWRHRLPIRGYGAFQLESGGSVRMLRPERDPLARELFWSGAARRSPADQLVLRWAERLARTSSTFLDIGASAGLFGLVAARANPDCRVVSYEILPESYRLLIDNILANDLVGRVEPRLCGLGPTNGRLTMPVANLGTQIPTSLSLGSSFSDGTQVPIERLDAQPVTGPLTIKIDVEGYEAEVFKGALNLLAAELPPILCEILPSSSQTADEISTLLTPLGYRWAQFTNQGLEPRARLAARRDGWDWLLYTNPAHLTP